MAFCVHEGKKRCNSLQFINHILQYKNLAVAVPVNLMMGL